MARKVLASGEGGEVFFLPQFSSTGDKDKVIRDKSPMLWKHYDGKLQPSNIEMNYASIWIQQYD